MNSVDIFAEWKTGLLYEQLEQEPRCLLTLSLLPVHQVDQQWPSHADWSEINSLRGDVAQSPLCIFQEFAPYLLVRSMAGKKIGVGCITGVFNLKGALVKKRQYSSYLTCVEILFKDGPVVSKRRWSWETFTWGGRGEARNCFSEFFKDCRLVRRHTTDLKRRMSKEFRMEAVFLGDNSL